MSIEVLAASTPEGWVLQTNDEFKDVLSGPFPSNSDLVIAAAELDVTIIWPTISNPIALFTGKPARISDLRTGMLFRVKGYWYRMVSHIPGNKEALLEVVGEKRNENLPADTEVTEVSVLSLH